jgi:hypothetical protein
MLEDDSLSSCEHGNIYLDFVVLLMAATFVNLSPWL